MYSMKNLFQAVLLLFLSHSLSFSQTYGAWKFGGSDDDVANAVVQTSDLGFIVTGNTRSFGAGKSDIYVIKYDANLNVQWKRSIGGTEDEMANDVVQTDDGGYIIAGRTNSFSANPVADADLYLVKLNSSGNIQWTKVLAYSPSTNSSEGAVTMRKAPDGSILIGGNLGFMGHGSAIVLRIDQNGIILSSGLIDETWAQTNTISSIYPTPDGGYAMTGYASPSPLVYEISLIKISNTDTVQWGKRESAYSNSPLYYYVYISKDMIQASDGGYVITGSLQNDSTYNSSLFLSKYSSSGTVQWIKYLNNKQGNDSIYDAYAETVIQTSDGGYAATGSAMNQGNYTRDILLMRYDLNGDLLWSKLMGTTSYDEWAMDLLQTSDGGFVIVGMQADSTTHTNDFYMLKTDANGNTCQPSTSFGTMQFTLIGGTDTVGHRVATGFYELTGGQVDSVGTTATICTASTPLNFSISGNLNCYGICDGTINTVLYGGMTPYTYSWSTGQTTSSLTNVCNGSYSVSVLDGLGNSASLSYYLSPQDSLAFSITTTDASCYLNDGTATANVTSGTPSYLYTWETGGVNSTETNLSPGTYTIEVDDSFGCVRINSFTIGGNPINSNISATPATCGTCADGTVSSSPTGGTGPYAFYWDPIGCVDSTCTGLLPGTYTVFITDVNSCSISDTIVVSAPTAVRQLSSENILVYPNPSSGHVTLKVSGELGLVTIYNSLGEIVFQQKTKEHALQIDLSRHDAGIYIAQVHGEHIRIMKE